MKRVLLGLASLWLSASCAIADVSIRDLVLQDCDKATLAFDSLDPAGRKDLAPYLKNVLNLQFMEPADPRAISVLTPAVALPGSLPSSVGDPNSLARALGAVREDKSKVCAARLLAKLGSDGAGALGDLVQTSTDPLASRDLRQVTEDAALAIAASLSPSVAADLLPELLPVLTKKLEGPSHNIALYFPSQALLAALVPAVLSAEGNSNEIAAQRRLLAWLDPGDGQIERILKSQIIDAKTCERALEVAKSVACPSDELVQAILDLASKEGACRLQALAGLEIVAGNVETVPAWCSQKVGLASGGELFASLIKIARDTMSRGDTAATLAILSALTKLMPGRNFDSAQSLISQALSIPCPDCPFEHPAVTLLKIAFRQSADTIFSALKGNDLKVHQLALQALPALAEAPYRSLGPCLSLISDTRSAVRRTCAQALAPSAKAAAPDLLRILKRKLLGNSRDYAALLLASMDESDKSTNELLGKLLPTWPCDNISDLLLLAKLPSYTTLIDSRISSCINEKKAVSNELLQLAAALPSISSALEAQLRDTIAAVAPMPEKLVALLALLSKEARANYLDALGEISISPSAVQCKALQLFWELSTDANKRSDYLQQNYFKIGPCLSDLALADAGSLLTSLLDKSAPRDRHLVLRAIGYASHLDRSLIPLLVAEVTADVPEQRYEAIVGLLRSESRVEQLDAPLRALLKSHLNWNLADEQLPDGAYAALQSIADNTTDKLERRAAQLVLGNMPARE
ncbi:MAG: hypothetical protein K1X79_03685 [Oligoflexia bacterium]|nr:hypothetical protein [Oligoflexia bacterium]